MYESFCIVLTHAIYAWISFALLGLLKVYVWKFMCVVFFSLAFTILKYFCLIICWFQWSYLVTKSYFSSQPFIWLSSNYLMWRVCRSVTVGPEPSCMRPILKNLPFKIWSLNHLIFSQKSGVDLLHCLSHSSHSRLARVKRDGEVCDWRFVTLGVTQSFCTWQSHGKNKGVSF